MPRPKPWIDQIEPSLFLRVVTYAGGPVLAIVDGSGERVPAGSLLVFKEDGTVVLPGSVDPDAAKRAGIKLDDNGRMILKTI